MKDLLSIKEFAKLSGVKSSTLRYWDEIGLFSPVKRDQINNYRYYSSEQTITVNFVKVLSSLRIPLKTIIEIEKNRTPESINLLIERHEKLLDMEMRLLRERYSIIHTRRDMISFGQRVIDGMKTDSGTVVDLEKISIINMEETEFILGPPTDFAADEKFYRPFLQFSRQLKRMRANQSFPVGGLHDDFDGFMKSPGQPDHFISIDPIGSNVRPAGEYLVGFNRNYYGQFDDLPERMQKYIKRHKLIVTGPVYSVYLHDEICVKDPSQYLVQVCVAVSRQKSSKS